MSLTFRAEHPDDCHKIFRLTEAAFAKVEHSDGSEPRIIEDLRSNGDLTLSLVAEDAGQIAGHIAFSPVTISDGTPDWYGLGPVSVMPALQSQGIGSRLVQRGLAGMRAIGARGIVLLGEPAYYSRFGFSHDHRLAYPGPPSEYFQYLILDGDMPEGEVRYAPAFG